VLLVLAVTHGCASSKASNPGVWEQARREWARDLDRWNRWNARVARGLARLPVARPEAPQSDAELLGSRSFAAALARGVLTVPDSGRLLIERSDGLRTERILPQDGKNRFSIVTAPQLRDLCADYGSLLVFRVAVTFAASGKAAVIVSSDVTGAVCLRLVKYEYERRPSEWTLTASRPAGGCAE
jgi:hypothetical protein